MWLSLLCDGDIIKPIKDKKGSGMINVFVNGEEKSVSSGSTVKAVVDSLNIKNPMFAVEYNSEIIQKDDYEKIQLQSGDSLEVVTFFGGG